MQILVCGCNASDVAEGWLLDISHRIANGQGVYIKGTSISGRS